ncbi:hypothetical protein COOONC_10497 [Cooperia oncophora]
MKDEQKVNAPDMLSTFFSFANLWDYMAFYGNDMRLSSVLLYNTFDRWSQLRAPDESSDEIDEILTNMEKRLRKLVKSISLEDSRLFLTSSERDQLLHLLVELDADSGRRKLLHEDTSYDKNATLLDHLREPLPEQSYHGNQYRLENVPKETYIKKFPEHIATEKAPWLYVENYTGSTKKVKPLVNILSYAWLISFLENPEMPAERLLDSWNWLENIRTTMERLLDDRPHNPLRLFVKVISVAEIAEMVMESLKAVCSLGQNLLPIGVFEYDLVSPIVRSVHAKFVQKLGIDETKMWSSVFDDYVALFDDDEIARLHTHREWWIKCCRRNGIPYEELHTESRQQIAQFLTEVIIEACKFPFTDKRGTSIPYEELHTESRQQIAQFLTEVIIEACKFPFTDKRGTKESRVFEEGRVTLSKMLAINSKLLALLDEHPFDFIVFPTHHLPMTVPPRPWCDGGVGGPEYTRRTQILRNLPGYKQIDVNAQMRKRLKSRLVFEMSSDVSKAELLDTLAVPLRSDTVEVPEYHEFFGEEIRNGTVDKKKYVEYSKNKAEAVKTRNELNSLWCWMKYRIVLARHFRGPDITNYFPQHNGFSVERCLFPISPYLSHMGDDVNRCILKFAKGRPLGDRGLYWLKLHCINLTGKMKRDSIKDRIIAADQQLDDILDSANHPLDGKGWWLESEEPWQTLAACMEIRDALAFPGKTEDFVRSVLSIFRFLAEKWVVFCLPALYCPTF